MSEIQNSLAALLPDFHPSHNNLQEQLANYIDNLITNDFSKLVFLLYRLDISENKLQKFISQPSDKTAGEIISKMIIERQLQKIESKKNYNSSSAPSDEEKW